MFSEARYEFSHTPEPTHTLGFLFRDSVGELSTSKLFMSQWKLKLFSGTLWMSHWEGNPISFQLPTLLDSRGIQSAFQNHGFQNHKVSQVFRWSYPSLHHLAKETKLKTTLRKRMSKVTSVPRWWTSAGFFWLLSITSSSSLNMKRGTVKPRSTTALQQETDRAEMQSWSNLLTGTLSYWCTALLITSRISVFVNSLCAQLHHQGLIALYIYIYLLYIFLKSLMLKENWRLSAHIQKLLMAEELTDGQTAVRGGRMEITAGWQEVLVGWLVLFSKNK